MKKILVLLIGSTLAFASQANSNQQNSGGFVAQQSAITTTEQGGFKGPSISETTVAKAKTLSDDTWVILTGKITKKIGDELYVFEDTTGAINVEIDQKRWRGQTVTPENTVKIEGKIDKEWTSTEIDVKQLSIVK
ncbi:YgiW/YdeI family stress tolerance OB fold protein [Proteus mirabilis]|uniref:YgiW/YdeI family stress tolerance OB fold protein n=1 Tax=Proteus mirabilis TaxID=584 RepID=UPI001A1BA642|nr:NirD/YgiW/YdeI family stress tolerance protein [Proteus mirabilis]MBI6232329.1 YgiW/YdeI family stress tolerance OB fold protein [Proteus mirabilis]MDC9768363.1 YgiW/YdeI family stress tolerance OB fold protein [Proteus mirabilis]